MDGVRLTTNPGDPEELPIPADSMAYPDVSPSSSRRRDADYYLTSVMGQIINNRWGASSGNAWFQGLVSDPPSVRPHAQAAVHIQPSGTEPKQGKT